MRADQARKLLIQKKLDKYSSLMEEVYKEGMADFKTQRAVAMNKMAFNFIIYIHPKNGYSYDERYYRTRAIIQLIKEIKEMGYNIRPCDGDGYDGGFYKISF